MNKTHRCIDCPQRVEHDEFAMCPSCGRCELHCDEIGHEHMKRRPENA